MTTHCRAPELESQIALYAAGAAILRKLGRQGIREF